MLKFVSIQQLIISFAPPFVVSASSQNAIMSVVPLAAGTCEATEGAVHLVATISTLSLLFHIIDD